ncbi:MAG TPA: response regulator transcription factor [Acetobacteraceae bacterium]|jgi:two-component system, NarL family, invasion response regulator UvrY|nr:response regulator transcription factor [Acetobacteraceae bacterium]
MSRVLLIEDHPIVRAGCRRLLEERGEDSVIEAETASEGLRLCRDASPDLVILDLGLADGGLALLRRLLAAVPGLNVLVFSMHEEPVMVAGALEAGARGYVSKNDDPAALLEAVERIGAGEVYLSRPVAQKLALMNLRPGESPLRGLSAREREVLALLSTGRSLAEVAAEIGVSYRTAAAVAAQIRAKLNLPSMAALIRLAVEQASAAARQPAPKA